MKNAVVLDAYFVSNGQTISDFKGGKAEICIACDANKSYKAWFVAKAGSRTEVPTTKKNDILSLTVEHFSHYVIEELEGYAACDKGAACVLTQYTDLKAGEWYHDGVHYCIEAGLMGGYGNGKFGPTDTLSRGMIVQMLYNLEAKPAVAEKSSYTDVDSDAWYADAVAWAEDMGIMGGYGNGLFGPEDKITREQLAKTLYAYAKFKGYDISASEELTEFTDAAKASTWAVDALKWAKAVKLVSGKGNGILDPVGSASRAEAATMFKNFAENIAK